MSGVGLNPSRRVLGSLLLGAFLAMHIVFMFHHHAHEGYQESCSTCSVLAQVTADDPPALSTLVLGASYERFDWTSCSVLLAGRTASSSRPRGPPALS